MTKKGLAKVSRVSSSLSAFFFSVVLIGNSVTDRYRTDIDKFLHTKSYESKTLLDDDLDVDKLYSYKSDYQNTDDLVNGIRKVGRHVSEEGSVLLKNDNAALPLKTEELGKVSMLGYGSYDLVLGGDVGAEIDYTNSHPINLIESMENKGFSINPTLKQMYKENTKLKSIIKNNVDHWGTNEVVYRNTCPIADEGEKGLYTDHEPSASDLSSANSAWKDTLCQNNVMIITFSRAGGENRNYLPGKTGLSATSIERGMTDPLGLSDNERSIINACVEAKKAHGGKVIILLNNASPMEIKELKDNEGIDSILQIGLPGAYGSDGIANLLRGEDDDGNLLSPSGHLSDTYATTNSLAPSALNYGFNHYTNGNSAQSYECFQVEAEGIYDGYYYYETRYADSVLNESSNASNAKGASGGNQEWIYENEVAYPFGYGLSYTTFSQKLLSLNVKLGTKEIICKTEVTNTGDFPAKSVVQLYASSPYTTYDKVHGIEKSAVKLVGYEKTKTLKPGESETLLIKVDAQYLSSWDSTLNSNKGGYILDDGNYYFSIGNGAHEAVNNMIALIRDKKDASYGKVSLEYFEGGDAEKCLSWTNGSFDADTFRYSKNGTLVTNQLQDMDLNHWMEGECEYLSRQDWENTWPKSFKSLTATQDMLTYLSNDFYPIEEKDEKQYPKVVFNQDNGLKLDDLKGVEDFDDVRWDSLMDQISLFECMAREGYGGGTTKTIESISSPQVRQVDGPCGPNGSSLGNLASKSDSQDPAIALDPYCVNKDDKNYSYNFAAMGNETLIASTFSKEIADEYGSIMGNYSLWANLPLAWSCGINLHRSPYNARNNEYYSEDPILTSSQALSFVSAGRKYGMIIAIKHFAFNDTEITRQGISTFMNEQKARELELRGSQAVIESGKCLGIMTGFNRAGVKSCNSHQGLMLGILRGEWGFKGLMSQDAIYDKNYSAVKEAAICSITMTCNTGIDSEIAKSWPYWTVENVSKDNELCAALKRNMKYQAYAFANSNAMDGRTRNTVTYRINTWYDNTLFALTIAFGCLLGLSIIGYGIILFAERKQEDAE